MPPPNNISRFSRSLWLTLGAFIVFTLVFFIYVRSEKQIDRANDVRFPSHLLVDELRQSSDDRTRMVLGYVITGNRIYKQHFQEILDIRDGNKRRPLNYHDFYWDQVSIDDQRPSTDSGQAIALLELMRQAGFSEQELLKLEQAEANSDTMTSTEFAAMSLVESTALPTDANRYKASQMLSDDAYHQAKAEIMRPINECYKMMEQRTLDAVQTAVNTAIFLRMVFISSGLLLLLLLWRAYRILYTTLGSSVGDLHQFIACLGQGDFSSTIPVVPGMKNSVLGWLSETQGNLARIDAERSDAEAKNQRITQFYSVLSQCNQAIMRCSTQEELFPQICRDAVNFGGMKMAWIGLLYGDSKQIKLVSSYGSGTEYLEGIQISNDENEVSGRGPSGTAMREDGPFWCQDFLHDPVTLLWQERGKYFGWAASAALPLHRNGVVIGVFSLYSAEVNAFDQASRDLLVELTIDIDYALSNFERETQRRHAENQLAESHKLLKTIIDIAPVRIFWKDTDLCYLGCNPAFARDAGERDPQSVIGKNDYQLAWKVQAKQYRAEDWQVMDSSNPKLFFDVHLTTADGKTLWLRTSKVPLNNQANETIGVLGIYEDVTEQKFSEERIHYLANFDPLTGLPNRSQLNDHLNYALSLAKRSNGHLALMFLDLDHFKDIRSYALTGNVKLC